MTPSELQRRKSAISIIDVIQKSGVDLKKHGANWQALCPFHNEKTPSFLVSEPKQIFKCFGCGSGGDVIEYVEKRYKLSFPDALRHLGIEDSEKPVVSRRREARAIKRTKHHARRKKQAENVRRDYELWLAWYGPLIVDLVEVSDRLLSSMPWGQLLEFSDIIKEKTIWEYHRWLIYTVGDEDALFELYHEIDK